MAEAGNYDNSEECNWGHNESDFGDGSEVF